MKYKRSLDVRIIEYLLKHERESRNKLKDAVAEKSDDVFDYHINKLINEGTLSRDPLSRIRGKKTFYSLTLNGKKQYLLNLLKTQNKSSIYKKIYEVLFFSEFDKPLKFLFTKNDFIIFLKDLEYIHKIEWAFQGDSYESDIYRIVYADISSNLYMICCS